MGGGRPIDAPPAAAGGADQLALRRCGLTVTEAAAWSAAGVAPYDAEAGVSLGLDPDDRVVARAVPGETLPARAGWVVARRHLRAEADPPSELPSELGSRTTITVSEIADLAGARRSIVSHWRKGKRQFPEPLLGGRSPHFDLVEVLRWMEDHGKLAHPPDGLWHWKRQVRSLPLALAGVDRLSVRGFVAGLVATVSLLPGGNGPLMGGTNPGRDLRRQAARVEREQSAWRGVLPSLLGGLDPGATSGLLPDLVRTLCAALAQGCPPAGVLDEALTALDVSGGSRTATDVELAELLTALLGAEAGDRVLDPACGEGVLLTRLAVHRRRSLELTGVELDPVAGAIARTRLLLRGLDKTVIIGDALRTRFDGAFDRVVVDPPLQERSAPAHLWLRLASRWLTGTGRSVVVTAVSTLGPGSAAMKAIAGHGGAVLVPSASALRTDARTGLAVCVLPGRDLVRGRVLITPPVGRTGTSRSSRLPPSSTDDLGALGRVVHRWSRRATLAKADGERGYRVEELDAVVESGLEPPTATATTGRSADQAAETARRLAAQLADQPDEPGVDELRVALRRFLAGR